MAGNIKKDELSFIRVWEWDSLSSELDHSLLRVTQLLPNSWWMPLCTRRMAYTQFSLTDNNAGQSIYCYFIRFTLTTVTQFKLAFFTRVFHLDDINPRVLADVSWVPWSQAHNYIISLKPAWNSTSGSPLFYSLFFERWSSFINHCVLKKNKKLKTKKKNISLASKSWHSETHSSTAGAAGSISTESKSLSHLQTYCWHRFIVLLKLVMSLWHQ